MWQLDGRSIGRHGNTARRHRHVYVLLLLLLPPSLFHTHHTHQREENSCWKISTCAYHTHTSIHYEVWARTRGNKIINSNLNRKTQLLQAHYLACKYAQWAGSLFVFFGNLLRSFWTTAYVAILRGTRITFHKKIPNLLCFMYSSLLVLYCNRRCTYVFNTCSNFLLLFTIFFGYFLYF